MVNTYIDPDIPYPDAKTAGSLSIGGPVKYILKKDSKLDDCWIAEKVVPHIFKMHKDKKAVVTLGKAKINNTFNNFTLNGDTNNSSIPYFRYGWLIII